MEADDVRRLFLGLLGREPESEAVVASFLALETPMAAVATIVGSPEFQGRVRRTPFDFFHSTVDAVALVRAFEDPNRAPRAGFAVNYFGLAIPRDVLPASVRGTVPDVEADPLPSNWHADTSEFAAALRAVDRARDRFVVVELGCGWGCWMGITGVSARRRGLELTLVGVEGDRHNLDLARQTLAANAFSDTEVRLVHGIVGGRSGLAAFPQQDEGGGSWGLAPIFDSDAERYAAAVASGRAAVLPVVRFADLAADLPHVDLVHIDIQGGEADLVAAAIGDFDEKVAHVLVGTHSRQIEGALFDTFGDAGWVLEVERPAILKLANGGRPDIAVDGVQGWRNPRVAPMG
jgi:FkbM family methyltransferase